MKKFWKITIYIVILGLALTWLFLFNEEGSSSLVDPVQEENKKDKETIDSLQKVIIENQGIIDSLKGNIIVIDSVREVKINEIKNLPITENIILLRKNLEKYEKIYFGNDSCNLLNDTVFPGDSKD